MNFIETFNLGQEGANKGLYMGEGFKTVFNWINGIQRARIYGIAAAPKAGKSTVVDAAFVIEPCLYVMQENQRIKSEIDQLESLNEPEETYKQIEELRKQIVDLEIIYLSYEIDRVSKEFDWMAHFLYRDYGVEFIQLEPGRTYRGSDVVPISADYLMGMCKDDNDKIIKVIPRVFEAIKKIYAEKIVPLFGEYAADGTLLQKGMITVLENKENPTGIRNYLLADAMKHGVFQTTNFRDKEQKVHTRYVGYTPNNPNRFVLVVTDHLRKLIPERNYTLKQTVDKFSEYAVELRNVCKYSFVHIIHLNRNMNDVNRMKYLDDMIFPTSEDIKETGNLSEDVNYMFTLFNPNDEKFMLKKHFNLVIKDPKGNLLYPDMRTIHLVESRHCPFPQHYRFNLKGAVKQIETLITK